MVTCRRGCRSGRLKSPGKRPAGPENKLMHVSLRICRSVMDDLAQRLVDYLRADLREPGLQYAEPPAAISGGYDTQVFGFRVQSAHEEWTRPLILRLLGSQHDPRRALRE